jgi:hypothetical protein
MDDIGVEDLHFIEIACRSKELKMLEDKEFK